MKFERLTLETVRTSSGICHKIGPLPGAHGRETGMACVYDDYPAGERSEKLLAYARLFSAAPELLAALEWYADFAGEPCKPGEFGANLCQHRDCETVRTARAAIAKARGTP